MPKQVKLTYWERRIVKNRIRGHSFAQISPESMQVEVDRLILKIASLYGCNVPQSDIHASMLCSLFRNFIEETEYQEYTPNEVELALLFNVNEKIEIPAATEYERVQFSGNTPNLNFVSSVLYNYSLLRNQLDKKIKMFLDGHEIR